MNFIVNLSPGNTPIDKFLVEKIILMCVWQPESEGFSPINRLNRCHGLSKPKSKLTHGQSKPHSVSFPSFRIYRPIKPDLPAYCVLPRILHDK